MLFLPFEGAVKALRDDDPVAPTVSFASAGFVNVERGDLPRGGCEKKTCTDVAHIWTRRIPRRPRRVSGLRLKSEQ